MSFVPPFSFHKLQKEEAEKQMTILQAMLRFPFAGEKHHA
ncbi:hypothetical protein JL2886_01512 [Phaeobacter gallaeciensis]|uniref:Uncharacterized protein n=1 Tax=Phaeobacter gallaeciensis TaxID=60890 RepID=A0A1B0ZQH2_9RHOB|nr:hypothetical protein JL2886_01512 [Phaeobacter gallaeciensis]